jgi:hypothetical protein
MQLHIEIGERRCRKSRLLRLIANVAPRTQQPEIRPFANGGSGGFRNLVKRDFSKSTWVARMRRRSNASQICAS